MHEYVELREEVMQIAFIIEMPGVLCSVQTEQVRMQMHGATAAQNAVVPDLIAQSWTEVLL